MRAECPNPRPDCKYGPDGCFADIHHLYYPRFQYRNSVERQFRALPENKELLCRAEHEERHSTEPIPEKPPREIMLGAIATYNQVAA